MRYIRMTAPQLMPRIQANCGKVATAMRSSTGWFANTPMMYVMFMKDGNM